MTEALSMHFKILVTKAEGVTKKEQSGPLSSRICSFLTRGYFLTCNKRMLL